MAEVAAALGVLETVGIVGVKEVVEMAGIVGTIEDVAVIADITAMTIPIMIEIIIYLFTTLEVMNIRINFLWTRIFISIVSKCRLNARGRCVEISNFETTVNSHKTPTPFTPVRRSSFCGSSVYRL